MTIFNYFDKHIEFEGTREECRKWILSQAFETKDGRRIFRSWEQDGYFVYDVGYVYCTTQDIFDK